MATEDDPQAQAHELRVALKEWERSFLAVNGRKPGRADIKNERDIAAKYKLYDKLTRKPTTTAKESKPKRSSPVGSKRKRDSGVGLGMLELEEEEDGGRGGTTPKKTSKTSKTYISLEASSSDPYDPPLNEFFSPAPQRTYIGPTPQKNGQVLGLFDLLSPESVRRSTPRRQDALAAFQSPSKKTAGFLAGTPSRSRMGPPAQTPSKRDNAATGILTPSRGKANVLLTPGKLKLGTPSLQRTKLLDMDETPEFLKRHRSPGFRPSSSMGAATGTDTSHGDADGLMNISWSPVAVRQPRKPIGRSFSQIIGENRKVEEERIEDDLAILRDLEQGSTGAPRAPPSKVLVGNSQGPSQPLGTDIPLNVLASKSTVGPPRQFLSEMDLPLGPDGERAGDGSDDEVSETNGTQRAGGRRYKKKGPKRQTRKFNIKPTQAKWQPEPEWKAGMGDDEEEAFVPETQAAGQVEDVPSDIENESSWEEEDGDGSSGGAKKNGGKIGIKAKTKLGKQAGDKKTRTRTQTQTQNKTQNKPKKTSATAHANFRSLKMRNKNSKAKRGGRFGRRRGF